MQASSDHPILTTPQGHTLTLVHDNGKTRGYTVMRRLGRNRVQLLSERGATCVLFPSEDGTLRLCYERASGVRYATVSALCDANTSQGSTVKDQETLRGEVLRLRHEIAAMTERRREAELRAQNAEGAANAQRETSRSMVADLRTVLDMLPVCRGGDGDALECTDTGHILVRNDGAVHVTERTIGEVVLERVHAWLHEQDLALGQLLMFARTGAARLVPMTSQPSQPGQDAHALPTDVVSAVVAEYARVARIALEKAP
jgi:PAS domain-containing protein